MIHISRTAKNKSIVVTLGNNGELLSSSEPLESKQSAWKNVKAQVKCFGALVIIVQDDTLAVPVCYGFNLNGDKNKLEKRYPMYVPGKNKKKVLGPKVR